VKKTGEPWNSPRRRKKREAACFFRRRVSREKMAKLSKPAVSPVRSPIRKGTSPDRINPRVPISPSKPTPKPGTGDGERDANGRFIPFDIDSLTAEERAEYEDRRDDNRLVKFGDVLDALASVPESEGAAEEIREKLLFGGNPKVRIKVKRDAVSDELGLGPSIERRLGADDFARKPIASTKPEPVKKKTRDSDRLRR